MTDRRAIDIDHSLWTRISLCLLVMVTTWLGAWMFMDVLFSDGVQPLDVPLLALFVMLFMWIALGFWNATLGYFRCMAQGEVGPVVSPLGPEIDTWPVTAILVPIYNEDPHRVMAGVRATYESLASVRHGDRFVFFILSDTSRPDCWLAEERAWHDLVRAMNADGRIFYRRRPRNIGRKAGNIEDFCERWGADYRYMIIFDADSVMSGPTLVEMVRRMEADAEIGILQAPPTPVNQHSIFARAQQFAAGVYGRIFTAGFALWTQEDGNYYGHNAILRTQAFIEHCGLPLLPGRAPMGGPILSHDFVEAALMRRAGFKVVIAHDLSGSYEECPATLIDFAQRDQRWCQGNLQHLRVVVRYGLHPLSRVHLLIGAMSYLSSPLWLLFMLLGVVSAGAGHLPPTIPLRSGLTYLTSPQQALLLFFITLVLLFGPKLWSFMLLWQETRRLHALGGDAAALWSVLAETAISVLTAPTLMVFHSTFVVMTFLGKKVTWGPQRRTTSGITWSEAAKVHWPHTLLGAAMVAGVAWWSPVLSWWMSPVTGPLLLSIPMSVWLSHRHLGEIFRGWGLFVTPEETEPPMVLIRQRELTAQPEIAPACDDFQAVLTDPRKLTLHLATVRAYEPAGFGPAPRDLLDRLDDLAPIEKLALLGDPHLLTEAHRRLWCDRPLTRLAESLKN